MHITFGMPQLDSERPVLVDKYLDRADELDVDALCDKEGNVVITGIMQHIEQVCGNKEWSADWICLIPNWLQEAGIKHVAHYWLISIC
jgi:carbamoyl-phosphate synthase large subunit